MSADATVKIGVDNSQLKAGMAKAQSIVAGWSSKAVGQIGAIAASIGAIDKAFSGIAGGFQFNYALANAEVGISNVLKRFQDLNDEAAKQEAGKAMQMIRDLEPKTAGGLQDLINGFMQVSATGFSVGLSLEEIIDLVGGFSNALTNAGRPLDQLGQELRSILTGEITQDSDIAKILGLTNEAVRAAQASGQLFNVLKSSLGNFGEAGDSAGVTMSNLKSTLTELFAIPTKPFFDAFINGANEATPKLKTFSQTLKDLGENLGSDNFKGNDLQKALSFISKGEPDKGLVIFQSELIRAKQLIDNIKNDPIPDTLQFGELKATEALRNELEKVIANYEEYSSIVAKTAKRDDLKKQIAGAQALAAKQEAANKDFEERVNLQKKEAYINNLLADKKAKREKNERTNALVPELESEADKTLQMQLSDTEKLADAENRLLTTRSHINKESSAAKVDQEKILQLKIQEQQLQQNILGLQQSISAANDTEAKSEARKKALLTMFQLENNLKGLRLEGTRAATKQADEAERQMRIMELQSDLMDNMGASQEEALRLAQERVALEDRAAKAASGERKIKGYSREQRQASAYTNPFRGLDAMDNAGPSAYQKLQSLPSIQDRLKTPALDAMKNPMTARAAANAKEPPAKVQSNPEVMTTNELLRQLLTSFNAALN